MSTKAGTSKKLKLALSSLSDDFVLGSDTHNDNSYEQSAMNQEVESMELLDSFVEVSYETEDDALDEGASDNVRKIVIAWEYEPTKELLKLIERHYGDIQDVRKRQNAFITMKRDLKNIGYKYTIDQIKTKWRSLLRSYKICLEHKYRTGKRPSRFYHFEEMYRIVGDDFGRKYDRSVDHYDVILPDVQEDTPKFGKSKEIPLTRSKVHTQNGDHQDGADNTVTEGKVSKRKRDVFCERLLEMKKVEYAKRAKRHQERMDAALKKHQLEMEQIKLLEALLKKSSDA